MQQAWSFLNSSVTLIARTNCTEFLLVGSTPEYITAVTTVQAPVIGQQHTKTDKHVVERQKRNVDHKNLLLGVQFFLYFYKH